MRLLLIEDEKPLSAAICKLLEHDSYIVDPIYNGIDGYYAAQNQIYDAIILDVMLPEMDGFTILSKIRGEHINTPVLMLTARGELQDRVQGLEAGADYYLPKPFEESELLACIHVLTRRHTSVIHELSFGNVYLNKENTMLTCTTTGQNIKLPAKEFQLMELFLRNPQKVLSKETTIERIWGFDNESEYNNLAVYLSFLRKKIAFIGANIEIKAIRGLGYVLEVRNDP